MTSSLYITRNGMLEPLGQSQVLSYLRGLSKEYQITLISFEKPEDWVDETAVQRVQDECDRHRIRWLPQRFHYRPGVIAPAWSMLTLMWLCLREIRRGNAKMIHARSYIPAVVAMIAGSLTGTPFIFDMRALWPEEMITAGRMKRGSWMHRGVVWAERNCLHGAAAIISLTEASVEYLKRTYPKELEQQRIVVIPTCADLERFVPPASSLSRPMVVSCIGTVLSGWFQTNWLRHFFRVASEEDSHALFEIVSRDDPTQIRRAVDPEDVLKDRLSIYSKPSYEMPETVQQHTASVMFYAGGSTSELGRSPTRMAEILGCGIPVVANAGVGDVAMIIEKYRVGVLATSDTTDAMAETWNELQRLLEDPDLSRRCQLAAEETFSLSSGTAKYLEIYQTVLGDLD